MFKKSEHKVYKLKSEKSGVIYVGRTGRATEERFKEHSRDKFWIREVSEVEDCLIGQAAQANLVESVNISNLKPVFNKKDRFDGFMRLKLEDKYTKFSHAFYVFNGMQTTCIPNFIEGYTLVDIIEAGGEHIGVYYDDNFNVFFSATDIARALNIKKFSKDFLISVTFEKTIKGATKTFCNYLCNLDQAEEVLSLSENDFIKYKILTALKRIFDFADTAHLYGSSGNISAALEEISDELETMYTSNVSDKKRIVYTSNKTRDEIGALVFEYNSHIKKYNDQVAIEIKSNEIFCMIEDIVEEYKTEHYYVLGEFIKFLEERGTNWWKILYNISKETDTNKKNITMHYAIAHKSELLYEHFIDFYNESL